MRLKLIENLMLNGIMKYKKENNKVLVVLEKGDEIFESIYRVIEVFKINFGWINGIGAAEKIILGAYPSKLKKYVKKNFSGEYEIASMMGNITSKENEPFVHLHAVISDEGCNAFAGHLFTATISVTCEIIINIVDTKIIRRECKDIGLFLWDFNNG